MVWLSGLLPYAQCEAVWQQIGHKSIAATSIWRQTQRYGERLETYLEAHIQTTQPEAVDWVEFDNEQPDPKGISMDGGMVNTREEGWRELKVGAVFDIETGFEPHPLTGYLTKMARGVNVHYTAVLGSKTDFEPSLWHLAWEHHVPQAKHQGVVADGAAWIWNIADCHFSQAYHIVDWYHATQHLASAAYLRYPEDEAARQAWETTMRDHLYAGQVDVIMSDLVDTPAISKAHYFDTHAHRFNYEQTRLAGFPLGSGTVESGIKQFKQRLSGAGMRWNIASAQQMASIRATVLSHTFFDTWQTVSLH